MVFFVLFLRKRLLHFLCSLLCYLFMYQNVRTNIKGKTLRTSRSQMFSKIAVLKNFTILLRKLLCWSLFLIKLHAWRPVFLLKKRQVFFFFYRKNIFLYALQCRLQHYSEFRNNSRITVTSPSNLLWKLWI